jgi:hypothetical protein
MDSTFDVFKVLPEGPRRITAVLGIRGAKVYMARLALLSPGEYFIRSEGRGVMARQSREWADVI